MRPAARAIRVRGRPKKTEGGKDVEGVLVGEVVERPSQATLLTFPRQMTGFPEARHRTEWTAPKGKLKKSEMTEDATEGRSFGERILQRMTRDEILEAQAEVRAKLKPKTITFLTDRAKQKRHASEQNVSYTSPVSRLRWNLEGVVVGWLSMEEMQEHPSDVERALYRDPLREDEGSAAPCGVYTLPEMAVLIQSAVQGQRIAGLRLLRQIYHRCRLAGLRPLHLPDSIPSEIPSLIWADVRAFILFELNAVALVRGAFVATSPVVALKALEILVEICDGEHPVDPHLSDTAQWLAFCTHVPPPLERRRPSDTWQALDDEAISFRAILRRELESGWVEDVRSAVRPATLPMILQLVTSLCLRGAELAERLSQDTPLLIRIRNGIAELPDLKTRIPFLRCLCTWSTVLPSALPLLKSQGWLELALCDIKRWMGHPVTADAVSEELTLLTWFFRLWRVSWCRAEVFLSMEDLFPIYFPLLSTMSGRQEVVMATTEVFLCLTATEDVIRQDAAFVPGLSVSCSASLRKAAAEWLTFLLEAPVRNEACCAAALMFLAQRRDATRVGQRSPDGILGRCVLELVSQQDILETCTLFDDANGQGAPPTGAMFITSVLKLVRATAKDATLQDLTTKLVESLSTCIPHAMTAIVHPSRIVELEDITKIQALCPLAQCAAAFLLVISETHPNALPLHDQLNFACRSVTWMPPGCEEQAMNSLSTVLTSDTIHASILSTLDEKTSKGGDDDACLPAEELRKGLSVLLDGFATTWCGHIMDDPSAPLHRLSPFSIHPIDLDPSAGSSFPPPADFLLRLWKTSATYQPSDDTSLMLLMSQLALVVYLEANVPNSLLSSLSPGEKLQQLIRRVVLEDDETTHASHPFIQRCFTYLVEKYIDEGREHKAFAQWDVAFVEHLINIYMASGEIDLGRIVALVFLDTVPTKLKIMAWTMLEDNALLHSIPARHLWYGHPSAYHPIEPSASLCARLATSLANGTLNKAARLQTGLHDWANEICHHHASKAKE